MIDMSCKDFNNLKTLFASSRGENVVSPLRISNTYDGLGQYVSWFKRMSTTEYIRHVKNDNWPVFNKRIWQRNYYEHVIRNDAELNRIRQYIIENPLKWNADSENTENIIKKDCKNEE